MNHQHEHHHPAGAPAKPMRLAVAAEPLEKDPVCGMDVPADALLRSKYGGKTYHFCSQRCQDRFNQDPSKFVAGPKEPAKETEPAPDGTHVQWTCPMHPQIVRDTPGSCPICGMALEPLTITAEEEVNPDLVGMTRRFWVGVALRATTQQRERRYHVRSLWAILPATVTAMQERVTAPARRDAGCWSRRNRGAGGVRSLLDR